MTVDDLTQRISKLYQRIEEFQQRYLSDPESSAKVLAEAMEELQISLEELSAADEELMQQNEELLASAEENRKLLAAVQEERDKLSALINSISDEIWFTDTQKKFTLANPSALREFGLTSSDIDVEELAASLEVYHPDGSPRSAEEAPPLRALQGEAVRNQEEMIRTPATGELWYRQVSSTPVKDAKGNIIGSVSIVRDITDRKKMEAELERIASFPKMNPYPIIEVDLEGCVRFLNPAADKQFPGLKESGSNHQWLTDWDQIVQIFRSGTSTYVRDLLIGDRWYQQSMYLVPNTQAIRIYGLDITEHKQAEIALRESEALHKVAEAVESERKRFFDVLETLPTMICLLTADYHVAFANRSFREKFGESQDRYCYEYYFGRNKPCEFCESYNVLKTGQPHHWEVIGADGSVIEAHDFPFTDVDGSPMILEMNIDITERKQTEAALHASSAYNRRLIEASLDPLVTIGPDGRITDVNAATEAATGYSREELIGTDFSNYFTEQDKARAGYQQVFAKGFVTDYPLTILHRNGKLTDVLYNANIYKDIQGKVLGVFAAARDVTERKRAEIELDKYRKHLEDLVLDRTRELKAANSKLQEEIIERKRMEEELQKARNELELRVQERTAELYDAKENLEVINEELQVEISEHEKTERDLMAAKEAAEAAVEAKAAFLANMSHELRTPLNAVIGFSSILLEENLTQDQKENIERIRSGGESLLVLISDILEFSKAEKEKITLELRPFSLKRCIEESLDLVAVQANDKGLNLAYTINYGIPDVITGDHGRLRQILVNLLSNAVKFTDEGDVSISVSSKVIEGNKRKITFVVMDTGIGMPQDKMDRLFKPFTQLEYVISRKRDGAGLGLAICKKLVELMGGEIWAESEAGIGSTFQFTIPVETIPGMHLDQDGKDKAGYENLSIKKPLAILVAEDNPSNQRVLIEMLKRLGYRADAVADGVEVLQALQIRPYDLIFMDIRMPEMDGLTATRKIRKLWPENGPKIIAITAFAMDRDQEICLEAGMDGYIAKPVKVDDLATLLCSIRFQE